MVFITPAGDSRGLYVANRTLAGFWVRENQGGRSTLFFDYRIVAHPLHAPNTRLPAVAPMPRTRTLAAPVPPPPPFEPQAATSEGKVR